MDKRTEQEKANIHHFREEKMDKVLRMVLFFVLIVLFYSLLFRFELFKLIMKLLLLVTALVAVDEWGK